MPVPQSYYDRLASIESGGDPNARNPKSSAKGKYQWLDATAKQYGITAPLGTAERAAQEESAIRQFTADNASVLQRSLGREPTPGELYLAHQQGATGASKLLGNPQAPAISLVGLDAVRNNRGNDKMTAQDFADQWISQFDKNLYGDAGKDKLEGGWIDPNSVEPVSRAQQNDWIDPNNVGPATPYNDPFRTPKMIGTSLERLATGSADTIINTPMNALNVAKAGLASLGVIPWGEGYFPEDPGFIPASDVKGRLTSPNYYQDPNRITDMAEKAGWLDPGYYPRSDNIYEQTLDFTTQALASGGINPKTVLQKGTIEGFLPALKNLGAQTAKTTLTQGIPGGATGYGVEQVLGEDNPNTALVKPLAQFGASVIGGAVPEVWAPSPPRVAASALKGLTPQQLIEAQDLMDLSYQVGSPITGAEAIAQIVGGKNKLLDIQLSVEEASGGRPIMDPFMNARGAQNAQVLGDILDQFPAVQSVADTPIKMADTAESVIKKATDARTAKVKPYYTNAKTEQIQPNSLNALKQDIQAEINSVGENSDSGKVLKELLDRISTDKISVLEKTYGEIGEKINPKNIQPGTAASSIRGTVQPFVTKLGEILSNESPSIKTAREIYTQETKNVVQPLQEGTIGALASKAPEPGQPVSPESLMRSQSTQLMPEKPRATDPRVIRQTVRLLKTQNPDIAAQWTRQNLKSIFDEVGKTNKSAQGVAFMRKIASNPAQRDNLFALIDESAGPKAREGFENFIKILDAQSTRAGSGSNTAGKLEARQEIGSDVARNLGLTPLRAISKFFNDWRYEANSEFLAKILTDPQSVKKLELLAKKPLSAAKQRLLINSIISANYEPPVNKDNSPDQ